MREITFILNITIVIFGKRRIVCKKLLEIGVWDMNHPQKGLVFENVEKRYFSKASDFLLFDIF